MKECIDPRIGILNIFYNGEEDKLIEKIPVTLAGEEYQVGEKLTLNDFFNGEVIYLGMYNGFMQFQVGKEENLFDSKIWVNAFQKVSEDRIATIYKAGTARDYIFKKGEWK